MGVCRFNCSDAVDRLLIANIKLHCCDLLEESPHQFKSPLTVFNTFILFFAVFEVECAIQNYHWGKVGESSEVARLSRSGNPKFNFEKEKPYAEVGHTLFVESKELEIIKSLSFHPLKFNLFMKNSFRWFTTQLHQME